MLASPDYNLTGSTSDQLEKVYLQQLIHFIMYPYDQFVTARRSGLPKFNSQLISRENYSAIPVTNFQLYQIQRDAYAAQGYTITGAGDANTSILNTERTWQDQGAPQWGEGPKN